MAKPFMSYGEKETEVAVERDPEVEVISTPNHPIEVDEQLRRAIGGGEGGIQVMAPDYTTLKKGRMQVSYAVIGDDYYYQVELLKPAVLGEQQILGALIQAFSTIVPQHVHTYIKQPPRDIDWPVFTVIVKGGARLLGAKKFMEEKLVNKLLELNFWS